MANNSKTNTNKLSVALDLRLVVVLLLVVIGVMLVIWKPWEKKVGVDERTIQVTGQATIKAEPDEFVFYPTYQIKNADKATALAAISAKSDEITKKLKELGVPDSGIKSDTNGYDPYYSLELREGSANYTIRFTITVSNRELAQKVQDYLVTTGPEGQVSPQANFSQAKRKEVENQARDEATKDARSKAEASAKNLGFKLGKVSAVNDGAGFDNVYPLDDRALSSQGTEAVPKLNIQPGENELPYSVTVDYYIR